MVIVVDIEHVTGRIKGSAAVDEGQRDMVLIVIEPDDRVVGRIVGIGADIDEDLLRRQIDRALDIIAERQRKDRFFELMQAQVEAAVRRLTSSVVTVM